jgi:hypothetical protein
VSRVPNGVDGLRGGLSQLIHQGHLAVHAGGYRCGRAGHGSDAGGTTGSRHGWYLARVCLLLQNGVASIFYVMKKGFPLVFLCFVSLWEFLMFRRVLCFSYVSSVFRVSVV